MRTTDSRVIYEGPSQLDGAPLVVIATDSSKNRKTGNMVQTWIMRADLTPVEAIKKGDDRSVCGECPHRPAVRGSCYVVVAKAPFSVWKAYKRGRYPQATTAGARKAIGAGRMVRLGAYGDPAAVPVNVWEELAAEAIGVTGYTHHWQEMGESDKASAYQRICMASCDSPAERAAAKAAGWRTFRTRESDEAIEAGEIICPGGREGGRRLTCETCGNCNGKNDGRRNDVALVLIVERRVFELRADSAKAVAEE
jgi:hypothetical protein